MELANPPQDADATKQVLPNMSTYWRTTRWLTDVLRQDISYAVRGLSRAPILATTMVVTLGFGVGANAAAFAVLDPVFFKAPPGVVDPGAIRRLYAHKYSRLEPWFPNGKITPLLGVRDLVDLGTAARGVARIEGDYLDRGVGLQPGGQPVLMTTVSPGYFEFLGVRPAKGRFFTPDEGRVSGPAASVAVISDSFWRTHFASAPGVLGKKVRVDEQTLTIVGIAPRGFDGLELEAVDLWVPLSLIPGGMSGPPLLRLLVRVDRGTNVKVLEQRLSYQFRRSHLGDPMVEDSSTIIVAPLLAARAPADARFPIPRMPERNLTLLSRLAGVGLVVFLIAIANVASLLLMRATRRQREIAVRVALGVSRPRLMLQLLIEGTLVAAVAACVALLFAEFTGSALRSQLSNALRWTPTVVDGRVAVFTIGIAVVAGLLSALAPAAIALRPDLLTALKSATGITRAASRTRSTLLVTQAALCMALLACAGSFLQSLRKATDLDRGFDTERTIQVGLPGYYANSEQIVASASERLRGAPEVEAVGRSLTALGQLGITSKVGPNASDTIGVTARGPSLNFVDPTFVQAVGLRVVEGRAFAADDNAAPVVMISASLAEALWPSQTRVGRCIHLREPHSPCREVVGVLRDVQWDLTAPSMFQLYVPLAQAWSAPNPALVPDYLYVRTRGVTPALLVRVHDILTSMVPRGADISVRPVSDLLEPQLRPWRLAATLFFILGALGLLAAGSGIYGLVAYDVTQRSRELGLRIALGATAISILRLVISSGLRVVAMGIAIGSVAALLLGRVMASLLFDTSPYEPAVLLGTALLLVFVAMLASIIPTLRALRVNPAITLSSE